MRGWGSIRLYKAWVDAVPNSRFKPSGALFLISSEPIAPEASDLLSTSTVCLSCLPNASAYNLAKLSLGFPPAVDGEVAHVVTGLERTPMDSMSISKVSPGFIQTGGLRA